MDLRQNRTWTLEGGGQQGDQGGAFNITVNNLSPQPICVVAVGPAGSDERGDNLLGSAALEAGEKKEFALDAGAHAVWAEDCSDAYLGVLWEVEQPEVLTIGGPGRTTNLLVQNDLEVDVCEIKISPPDEEDWGDNWLQEEGGAIRAGKAWRFWVEPGLYDVLARDCEGEELERVDDVDLSQDRSWTLGGGFSFADAGEDDVTDSDDTYTDYVELQDDTGAIQLEVPAAWDDVDGSPMTQDDGTPYAASIRAAPDLGAHWDYQAPGVRFAAHASAPGKMTVDRALEIFDYSDECEYVGREPYSDSLYEGAYDHYTNCAGTDVALYVVVAFPEDETYVNIIIIQALTDADLEAADHALATFQVVGDLP